MLSHFRACRKGIISPAVRSWTLYSTSRHRTCPSCSTPLPTALPTCPTCSHIEPLPPSITHFDVFGLQEAGNAFALDTRDLRRRFLQAQRVCHPDRWSGKGERKQSMAAAQSSYLNTAYRTLTSPVLRTQYILAQHGHAPSETDKLTDEEFITEIMESREDIDNATSQHDVEEIRERNDAQIRKMHEEIESLMKAHRWSDTAKAVVKLKYLEGVDAAAKEWLGKSQSPTG